jgi:glycine/D-amino acid oxidase-like deaminating enzyme
LYFPGACTLATPQVCRSLLDHPKIEVITGSAVSRWPATATVLACGTHSRQFPGAQYLELATVAGQVELLTLSGSPKTAINLPIVGNGYLAPADPGLVVGATYEYRDWSEGEATKANLRIVDRFVDGGYHWHAASRGARSVSSDRAAVAGPLFDSAGEPLANRYVSTGHGSMGTVSGPFCAAIVSARITGTFPPVTPDIESLVSPLRFRHRQRKRGYRFDARN